MTRSTMALFMCIVCALLVLAPSTIEAHSSFSDEQEKKVKKVTGCRYKAQKIAIDFTEKMESLEKKYEKKKGDIVARNKSKMDDIKKDIAQEQSKILRECEEEWEKLKEESNDSNSGDSIDIDIILDCREKLFHEFEEEMESKLKETADEVAEKQLQLMQDHVADLVKLQIEGIKKQGQVKDELQVVIDTENDPLFIYLDGVFSDEKEGIEYQLKALSDICEGINDEISALENIMYGMVCFQFEGVSSDISHSGIYEFNDKTKTALELVFADEEMDIAVVATDIMKQVFIKEDDATHHHRRRRRGLRSRSGTLLVKSVVGFYCTCSTDTLTSDVYHRARDLFESNANPADESSSILSEQEFRRDLWESDLEQQFGEMMKTVFHSVDSENYSVKTVPCGAVGL